MGLRLNLHQKLIDVSGTGNIYFQPLPNITMKYPCVVYERTKEKDKHANNAVYNSTKCYTATVIDSDPDSDIPDKVKSLPLTRFTRHFVADNLNHDVYEIYF